MSDRNEFENGFGGNNGSNNSYNSYNQNNNNYDNRGGNVFNSPLNRPQSRALSVSSLVTGILGVICCCLGWAGVILGIVAIVCSVLSRVKNGYFDGLAIAGLILGIFGAVFGAFLIITSYFVLDDAFWAEFEEEFWKEYNKQYPDGPGNGNL